MAYMKMPLLGIAGEVVVVKILGYELRRRMYTHANFLGSWPVRLDSWHFQAA